MLRVDPAGSSKVRALRTANDNVSLKRALEGINVEDYNTDGLTELISGLNGKLTSMKGKLTPENKSTLMNLLQQCQKKAERSSATEGRKAQLYTELQKMQTKLKSTDLAKAGAGGPLIGSIGLGGVVGGGLALAGVLVLGGLVYASWGRGVELPPSDTLSNDKRIPKGAVVDPSLITNTGSTITIPYSYQGENKNLEITAPKGLTLKDISFDPKTFVLTANDQYTMNYTWHLMQE